jgi:hypothetical protein
MNGTPHRAAALTGLAVATALALWWLGGSRLALDRAAGTDRVANDALYALVLVRATLLALGAVRWGALWGWRVGAESAIALVAASWPVGMVAWLASTVPPGRALLAELALLAGCAALPAIGAGLRRAVRDAERAELLGVGVGAGLAAGLWLAR